VDGLADRDAAGRQDVGVRADLLQQARPMWQALLGVGDHHAGLGADGDPEGHLADLERAAEEVVVGLRRIEEEVGTQALGRDVKGFERGGRDEVDRRVVVVLGVRLSCEPPAGRDVFEGRAEGSEHLALRRRSGGAGRAARDLTGYRHNTDTTTLRNIDALFRDGSRGIVGPWPLRVEFETV
jgi:hypothetical protein